MQKLITRYLPEDELYKAECFKSHENYFKVDDEAEEFIDKFKKDPKQWYDDYFTNENINFNFQYKINQKYKS